jgi:hypothetical protein
VTQDLVEEDIVVEERLRRLAVEELGQAGEVLPRGRRRTAFGFDCPTRSDPAGAVRKAEGSKVAREIYGANLKVWPPRSDAPALRRARFLRADANTFEEPEIAAYCGESHVAKI